MNKHFKALELDKILDKLSDYAQSAEGKELCRSIEPMTDLASVQTELKRTVEAFGMLGRYQTPFLGSLKNVNNMLARADAGSVLSPSELLTVAEDLRIIRALQQWRSNQDSDASYTIDIYFNALRPDRYLEEKITSSILSPEEISDNASPALADIRRKIKSEGMRIREKLDNVIHSSSGSKYLQDAIVTQRNGRFCVPVKAEYRSKVPGLVHDTSATGQTLFIEPMGVVDANNEINVLKGKEKEEIERILSELSADAANDMDDIKYSCENAVELDVIFAKASYAYELKATEPKLNDKGETDLINARHPLLNKDKVVPISINLGKEFDTLVITGPNTGGKTVSVKTLGLLTLMAQCGMMIPADENSKICVYKKIFADIGDEQSIEQSLSTFSSHMVNIVEIIKEADDNSLALIDELGAGTDPVEGAALAMAIIERLREKGTKIAVTTHYAELKAYALSTDGVQNGSCEFDVKTLRPTYRLLIGVPGRSNAFAISEKLGMDPEVIDHAKSLVSSDNTKFEDVVDTLEKTRIEMESERNEAQKARREAEELKRKSDELTEKAEKERDKIIQDARSEAMRLTERSKREADALLNELNEVRKQLKSKNLTSDAVDRARQSLKRGRNQVLDAAEPIVLSSYSGPDRPLKVGDFVRINNVSGICEVTAVNGKGRVEVRNGALKMNVKEKDCILTEKPKEKNQKKTEIKSRMSEPRTAASSSTRLDLRGMTTDEALDTLDKFIDSMVMMNIEEATVIHGKGTGALRKAVQSHLKGHPQVKEYRLGTFGEGEDGVTIIKIK